MVSPEFGSRADRRRKRITALVAVALVAAVLAVAAAYWRSASRKPKPLVVAQALPTNVGQQLSGYSFTRSVEGRRIFTVHAARTVAFRQGGATVLQDVFVELFGRAGDRRDILRTGRGDYNPRTGEFFAEGKVEIELNAQAGDSPRQGLRARQPVYLETAKVSFREQGSRVESDEPVKFRIGPASGSARGMSYATRDGRVELKSDIQVNLNPLGGAHPPAPGRLTAARLVYDKPSGEIKLAGPIEITQGNRRVSAGRGAISLDRENRVTGSVLEDGVRGSDTSPEHTLEARAQRVEEVFDPASGQLRRVVAEGDVTGQLVRRGKVLNLASRQFEMTFAGRHPEPQDGSATGNVQLISESSSEKAAGPPRERVTPQLTAAKQTLTAAQLRFSFSPEARSLKEAQTVGPGMLVIVPADPKAGARVVTAEPFVMTFDKQSRLENLRGLSQARIVFQPAPQAPPGIAPQESSSDRLDAVFDPATETLRTVEQSGDFQFHDGDRQASAEQARYDAHTQVMALTGRPQVWDTDTRARADRVLVDIAAGTAEGLGHVQSTHVGSGARASGAPRDPRPGETGDPTNVVADRMVAERRSQLVHYEGHVRVWHSHDVVESSSIDVYKTQRRVSSGAGVLTSHVQPAVYVPRGGSSSPARGEARPVTIRADHLEFFDSGRKASYRGNVQLETENTTLTADRLDVYFSAGAGSEASEIERAVADGHVNVTQQGRRATGEHAEYFAESGKILLTGGPPALYDADKDFTTGRRLTFFLHDDTVIVDGDAESPTVSKHRIPQ